MNFLKKLLRKQTAAPVTSVRNPYIVGGWVVGGHYYGNARLRRNLLSGSNDYIWVIGTRRVGKTSLLRQLALQAKAEYIPIYWDMQGCQTEFDLSQELFYAIEDQRKLFAKLDYMISPLEGADIGKLLRSIARVAAERDRRILLLIDETEALMPIVQADALVARRLRAAFQRPTNLRVILASTKNLAHLHHSSQQWPTSSFLHMFSPHYLSGLAAFESAALIRQTQSKQPVSASDEVVEAIQFHTNNHPYLLQWLCYHLFQDDNSLRMPTESDLVCDPMLDSLFTLKFMHLSPTERQMILFLHEHGPLDGDALTEALGLSADDARTYLYDLSRLGYTRQVDQSKQITISDSFFKDWLDANADEFPITDLELPDELVQEIAAAGRESEESLLLRQLQRHRINLARLELKAAGHGAFPPLHIQNEIDIHQRKINSIEQRLDALHS
ncbi:MAG TPA: ATP-binding protein [Caldilineae bacterium]|nr:ATP-binding protein [Caldilineae bacterium]